MESEGKQLSQVTILCATVSNTIHAAHSNLIHCFIKMLIRAILTKGQYCQGWKDDQKHHININLAHYVASHYVF